VDSFGPICSDLPGGVCATLASAQSDEGARNTASLLGQVAGPRVGVGAGRLWCEPRIGPSIIHHERGDEPKYLNTAWTIQAVRGVALILCAAVAAVPVAHFYRNPELSSLIVVVAFGGLLISGFNSTKLFTATRRIALGRLTVIDLASQLLGLVVTAGVTYVTRSIWAIVWGGDRRLCPYRRSPRPTPRNSDGSNGFPACSSAFALACATTVVRALNAAADE
jgi:hypothetical protein